MASSISAEFRWSLIQIHAISFIIAWLFIIVTTSLITRYLRPTLKTHWFSIHRTFNCIALALMALGTLTIFIAMDWNWLGPKPGGTRNTSSVAFHTLFGVFAIVLAFIQPLNAFLRCDPHDIRRRPYFNWAHRVVGLIAWVFGAGSLGIACFYFGKRFINPEAAFPLFLALLVTLVGSVAVLEWRPPATRRAASIAVSTIAFAVALLSFIMCLLILFKPCPQK